MRKISAIVAMSENGVIGQDNRLIWHLPNDLKHFKAITIDKPIVMGRKTYESIGRPLPQRRNVILSSDQSLMISGCEVMHSVEEILVATQDAPELMITGGGEIYRLFMPYVTYLYITYVHVELPGEVTFPALNASEWREVYREKNEADESHIYKYTFVELEKLSERV
jgi:dihydrofolate reductase